MISQAAADGERWFGKRCESTPRAPSGCFPAAPPCWLWPRATRCRRFASSPGSFLARFSFQGTADDARTLLTEISGTVVTVIALVLGLTVVALQLSSTQFSPRLLRNFLRDRGTQVVLSVFIATFVYSAAGLFTVGVEEGSRTEDFPRLAISGAIMLLFASLAMVVYFADHLVHSIQIDAITRQVEKNTRQALHRQTRSHVSDAAPRAPPWAITLLSRQTGYVQTIHPELLLPLAVKHDVTLCLRARVGQHLVAGTTIAWVWGASAESPLPDARTFEAAVNADVRIGFERTLEQDVAFGIRQLIDIASKALSAAINDPYTAVQAIDHLGAVCADLATQPLGPAPSPTAPVAASVIVPGNTFADYIFFICGLVGRYGARDLTVSDGDAEAVAHLRLDGAGGIRSAAPSWMRRPPGSCRTREREMARPADLETVRQAVESLQQRLRV